MKTFMVQSGLSREHPCPNRDDAHGLKGGARTQNPSGGAIKQAVKRLYPLCCLSPKLRVGHVRRWGKCEQESSQHVSCDGSSGS